MNLVTIEKTLEHILKWEGGFVDHPDDVGGPTNFGITMPTLSTWLGRTATYDDITGLDRATAIRIYKKFFIEDKPYAGLADPWTFMYVVDMGALHLPKTVAKIVQKASRPLAKVDGIFGEQTLGMANKLSMTAGTHEDWKKRLRAERIYHYGRRVRDDPTQAAFLLGWLKRANDL